MKKWSDYLTTRTHIANKLGLTTRAVDYWAVSNKVPEWHFEKLETVLASLGHQLTPIEMRKLNEQASHSKI